MKAGFAVSLYHRFIFICQILMHPIDYVITVSHYAVLYLEKLHEGEMQPMTLIKIS